MAGAARISRTGRRDTCRRRRKEKSSTLDGGGGRCDCRIIHTVASSQCPTEPKPQHRQARQCGKVVGFGTSSENWWDVGPVLCSFIVDSYYACTRGILDAN